MRKGRRLDRNGLNVRGERAAYRDSKGEEKEDGPNLENIINCISAISRPQLDVTEEGILLCSVVIAVREETRTTVYRRTFFYIE